jgi:hypothetical protein
MATIDRRGATVSAADPPIGTNPNPDLAIKAPARAATTGSNITLSGLFALDGVALAAGDRVLVKDQTDARTNGLYNASTGPWTRTIDAANNSQWATGTLVNVTAGTANTGKTYQLSTAVPVVLGTSNLTFALLAVAAGAFIGDSGTGGASGLVPAPPAGSASAGKFLSAAGDFEVPPAGAIGALRMFPTPAQGTGAWSVIDPWGNPVSTAGTTTQGLQEAINAAITNRWPLRVSGQGTITCSTAVIVKAGFMADVQVDASVIVAFGTLGSATLLTIDSQENSDIRWRGQITQTSGDTGPVVELKPINAVPLTGNINIAASIIEFYVISPSAGGIGIQINPTNGGILGNQIKCVDPNGGVVGIKVLNPGTAFISFQENIILWDYIHRQAGFGIQNGTSNTNAGNMRRNIWMGGRISPNNIAAVGFSSWGSNDTLIGVNVNAEEGSYNNGIVFQAGADFNTVIGGQIAGPSGTATIDSDGLNTFVRANAITTGPLQGQAGNASSTWVRAMGQLTAQMSQTATGANTNETDLQAYTLPANTLDIVSRGVRVTAWGSYGANANGKTIRLYFGTGNVIMNSTALTQNGTGWWVEAEIYKTGTNTQCHWGNIIAGNSVPGTQSGTDAQTDSAGILIKVTGQNSTATANDVVCRGMSVKMIN